MTISRKKLGEGAAKCRCTGINIAEFDLMTVVAPHLRTCCSRSSSQKCNVTDFLSDVSVVHVRKAYHPIRALYVTIRLIRAANIPRKFSISLFPLVDSWEMK
jgi:hypothetical protein